MSHHYFHTISKDLMHFYLCTLTWVGGPMTHNHRLIVRTWGM